MKTINKAALWIGLGIVVTTHIYMLVAGLPSGQVVPHAVVNLIAAGLIIFAKYKN